jgi:hypothetical protein
MTDVFRVSAAVQPQTEPKIAPGRASEADMEDFISFFRGPFHGDERSSPTPDVSAASAPARSQPGDFTKMFGKSESMPPSASAAGRFATPEALLNEEEVPRHKSLFEENLHGTQIPGGYRSSPQQTEILGLGHASSAGYVHPPSRLAAVPPLKADVAAVPESPGSTATPAWQGAEPVLRAGSAADGATRILSASASDSASGPATSETGPSEFTTIISGGLVEHNRPEESLASAPANDGSRQKLGTSASPPSFSSPPPPQVPPFGRPSQLAADPLPPAPAPQKPTVPWMPILILNALLILAVLLVLFFVLKH